MIWKKKPNQSHEHADVAIKKKKKIKEQPFPAAPPPSSSSSCSYSSSSSSSTSIFSLSNLLPLSWLSKLKKEKPTTKRSTGSHPKPLFSPPTSLHSQSERISAAAVVVEAPRRLSVGDDNSHRVPIFARSARHHSVGGEIDLDVHFRSDLHLIRTNPPTSPDRPDSPALPHRRRRPRRRRADHGILEIQLDQNSIDLKPIATDRMDDIRTMKSGRRSFSGKIRPRVRVSSPRLTRKSAAEDEKRRNCSSCSNFLESFAVVKSSRNPSRDFRDSMVEMILEKGIQRPEELEGLLACYLELNSDEHHDVIVKVFMQVWFDLNREVNRPV